MAADGSDAKGGDCDYDREERAPVQVGRAWMTRLAVMLIVMILTGLLVVVVTVAPWRPAASAGPLSVRGADISFTPQEEAAGTTYSDGGERLPLERILAAHGANYVRLRVWVDPPPGYSDERSALVLARRARAAGLKILLVPHYSDFWADPHSQETPAAWRGADLAAMIGTVRKYTRELVAAFASQGTPIDMIQIGNEITNGMLWPIGAIEHGPTSDWSPLAAIVNSAISGAREGQGRRHLSIVIHIDSGGDTSRSQYFFDELMGAGVTSFDTIGLTYYPYWNGSLAALRANLDNLAARYHRNILIVETAYPWTLVGAKPGDWVSTADQLPDRKTLPATAEGQENYFRELRRLLREVPDHRGLGFFDWEPGWLSVAPKAGEPIPTANLAMFDGSGAALPSLDAFSPVDVPDIPTRPSE